MLIFLFFLGGFTGGSLLGVSYRGIVEVVETVEYDDEGEVVDKEVVEELGNDGNSVDRQSGLVLSNS